MENSSSMLFTGEKFVLRLFVSGMSPRSMQAIENINKLCEEHLKDIFELEIIDIYKNPEKLQGEQVVFSPSLIKQLPLPKKMLIGDFSDQSKVIKALGISIKEK